MLTNNINELRRQEWLKSVLTGLPKGWRILDAGAGELKNKQHCLGLDYVSQDFCQYEGQAASSISQGLPDERWDTRRIDLVSDITNIPAPDASFDAILCSEVLEHVPEPTHALDEFLRLLRPGGKLILTAPFASLVHMAPYHFASGFSRYWYEFHLPARGFEIELLVANGDWFSFLEQELRRLGATERRYGGWSWPFAYVTSLLGVAYLKLRSNKRRAEDLACLGWHCVAVKK